MAGMSNSSLSPQDEIVHQVQVVAGRLKVCEREVGMLTEAARASKLPKSAGALGVAYNCLTEALAVLTELVNTIPLQ